MILILVKAVLLCRVSSKEQEETGYSLPAQEKLLNNYSDQSNFKVARIFTITESASGKKQREIFDNMMVYVKKNNINIIVCEKADRLTRNFRDMVDIDKWLDKDENRQIHLVKDSLILHKNSRSQEKLNWGIRILFAKNYIDNLSEEVKKGQKEKIAQGWLPTSPPPGYKTTGEKGHKIHVIDHDTAPLAKKMFELYDTGNHSIKTLSEEMYKAGLRSRKNNRLPKSRIHTLLTDPFYYGAMRWNGEIHPAKHDAIIDKPLFDRVQKRLKSKTTPKYSKHKFVFRGMISCSECGGMITWEIQKGHRYGHCNHYRKCKQVTWIKENEMNEQIYDVFELLRIKNTRLMEWIRKALKETHKDKIEYYTASLNELQSQQKQVESRLDRLYDAWLDGKIPENIYNKKLVQYKDEKESILTQIKKHSDASNKHFDLGVQIYSVSQNAERIYRKAKKIDKKRNLLNHIFQKMSLDEGELSYEYTPAYQILAKAVEKTNSSKIQKVAQKAEEIFELKEKTDNMLQTDPYERYRSTLLRD